MTFSEATGHEGPTYEDQGDTDYIRDDGGFAVYVSGHYTVAELEMRLAQLREANRYYVPREA